MKQQRTARPQRHEEPEAEPEERSSAPEDREREKSQAYAEAVEHEMDGLLAEIDEILEENAEEFVKEYIQKGGQ